jgi:NAD dependent epimerase/dehydratase family enzyme
MKILITGATGLVGSEIVRLCKLRNIVVNYLTTRKEKIENTKNFKGFLWNPAKGEIDPKCIDGVHAIINLAGANVAKRWDVLLQKSHSSKSY